MGENNTISSVSSEFISTIHAFSQYISHQKSLGNRDFNFSGHSLGIMEKWGNTSLEPFFFQGPDNAQIFFVDSEGSFFNGEPGALFVKILNAMHLSPESVFICNAPDSVSIQGQIKTISPKIVITLGQRAGQLLLNLTSPMEQFQGKFHSCNKTRVMPTLHPSALLQDPGLKRKVWDDMLKVMEFMGLPR